MNPVTIQPDLALFCQDMIQVNGFDPDRYVNGLLEKGIRADLLETYTEESVRAYLHKLVAEHVCEWSLLQPLDA
jgi:hypothetical protein